MHTLLTFAWPRAVLLPVTTSLDRYPALVHSPVTNTQCPPCTRTALRTQLPRFRMKSGRYPDDSTVQAQLM